MISYGSIDEKAPRRLFRLFALEALLGGVAPWPASPETFDLLPLLKPLGDIESYRFADWRNEAVSLSDPSCASAVYSRAGEAYLLIANLDRRRARSPAGCARRNCPSAEDAVQGRGRARELGARQPAGKDAGGQSSWTPRP